MWRLLFGLCFCSAVVIAEPRTLYYASHQSADDPHRAYMLALLDAVGEDRGWSHQWLPHPSPMSQLRMQHTLRKGDDTLHLAWMMTNQERENTMQAVPIPLFMGLIGMRVPLLSSENVFIEEHWTEEDWKTLRAGQLADWPDTDILTANGFSVMTTSVYRSLFLMLEAKRFDYFPRSVIEVEQELLAFQGLAIGMSQHWLLYYPAPLYFFLPPNEVELAKELHEGLMNLHKKNQFLPIFLRFYGERIERLRLSERRVLRLHNPLLPASAPLNQPELWWSFPNAD